MSNKERLKFEQALSRLEAIVEELEDDSIELEKSIKLYEEGIALSKVCSSTLEDAELRIKKVKEEHALEPNE